MWKICALLLFVVYINEAVSARSYPCPTPKLQNGRVRLRQRGQLARFFCLPTFTLVGTRYATCHYGSWEEEIPVCVKPGCPMSPNFENGLQWRLHQDAWVVTFCYPGYELNGSAIVYCNGHSWNGTFPNCVETKTPPQLSCDFEKDLCGWTDDELHDFDWRRFNRRTPSFFLKTGPSFDHTLGEGKAGYYMYIESTSRMENETARLISPIYAGSLSENGCFSFYYHMYGRTIGGLKVYQKPDRLQIRDFLALNETEKLKYTLFEKWGNQGDFWAGDVSRLTNFNDSFQIIIEGIRGSSFTSDIAIDDVAILQGDACKITTTPQPPPVESCAGRCFKDEAWNMTTKPMPVLCGCHIACLNLENCCQDFFETCVFNEIGPSTPEEIPQTEKLVAANTTISSTVSTSPRTTSTTPPPTTSSTPPTTTSTTHSTTTFITKATTSKKFTVRPTSPTTPPTTAIRTTAKKTSTTTTHATTLKTTKVATTTAAPKTTKKKDDKAKYKKEKDIENTKHDAAKQQNATGPHTGGGVKYFAITTAIVLICACTLLILWRYRGANVHIFMARLRGHTTSDPEVRYLSRDDEDDH